MKEEKALAKLSPQQPELKRSLDGQIVLEEEEYIECLSYILKRDFFPLLARSAPLAYTNPLGTPGARPTTMSTPNNPPAIASKINLDMSLDDFQAAYTTEDNSSYPLILNRF
jgi:protein DGCR14